MKLQWKTRGNASPQGKARVYLSGHPTDVEQNLEQIAQDLFQSQDCAVYYDAEPEGAGDPAEWLRQLEQMQLFAVPVTSRFLYQPNRARQEEFPFAIQRRIPILPLMQEQGVEAEFNRICGDLQLLNKNDPDPAALPYEEKLEKFLSSVLVGGQLAAQIRDAFDAYVFLSYRKKDRRYAQQLMRLIHKNDFCRNIAIWYDEFLVPGENFNEAIAEALKKSALFALTVTPSLVEEGNYVMRIEYPEAQKAGKTILPVEMAPTDRKRLEDCYQSLPPCAQAQDEPGLSAALLEAVQKLAIGENDSSPEHDFFIGLAYLSGVDVEVDRRRALELITGSAEAGLPEAMDKLAGMYETGEGVRRDLEQAVAWRERLEEWYETRFEAEQDQKLGRRWLKQIQLLGDRWMELDRFARAEQVYQKMNQVARRLTALFPHREERAYLANSLEALGDAALKRGDQQAAKDYFTQSLHIREQMDKEKRVPRLSQDITSNYIRLGRIALDEEYLIAAREYFELGLSHWKEDESQRGMKMRARLLERIGDVWRKDAFPDKALDYYQQSLELCQQLWRQTRQFQFQGWTAELYDRLGNLSMGMSENQQAKRYYDLSMEIMRQDYQRDPIPGNQRDLAMGYVKVGALLRQERDLSGAWQAYGQALEIYSRQAEQIGTIETKNNLALLYGLLAELREDQGNLEEARAYLEKDLLLCRQIVEQSKMLVYKQNLADCLQELGRICHAQQDLEPLGTYLRESMEIYRQAARERGAVQTKWDLADACDSMADYCLLTEQREQALEYQQERMEIIQQIHERYPTLRTQRAVTAACNAMSDICRVLGRREEAKQWASQALGSAQKVWEQTQDLKDYRSLAVCCKYMGDIRLDGGDWTQAKRDYERAANIHRELAQKQMIFQALTDLAFITQQVAGQYKKHGELKEAESYYQESLQYRRQMWEQNPIPYVGENLYLVQQELGKIYQMENRRREAGEYFRAAAELSEALGRRTGEERYQKMSQVSRRLAEQTDKGPLARMKDKLKFSRGKKS